MDFKKYWELVLKPSEKFADYISDFRLKNVALVWGAMVAVRLVIGLISGVINTAGSSVNLSRYYGANSEFAGTFNSFLFGNSIVSVFLNVLFAVIAVTGAALIAYLIIKSKTNKADYKEVLKIYLLANLPVTAMTLVTATMGIFVGFANLINPALVIIPSILICVAIIPMLVAVVWFFVMFIQGLMAVYDVDSTTATLSGCLSVFVVFIVIFVISIIFGALTAGIALATLGASEVGRLPR